MEATALSISPLICKTSSHCSKPHLFNSASFSHRPLQLQSTYNKGGMIIKAQAVDEDYELKQVKDMAAARKRWDALILGNFTFNQTNETQHFTCRVPRTAQVVQQQPTPLAQPCVPNTCGCYHCGNPNHLRNVCPQLTQAHQVQSATTPYYLTHAYQAHTHHPDVPQAPPINQGQPYLTQHYQTSQPQAQVY